MVKMILWYKDKCNVYTQIHIRFDWNFWLQETTIKMFDFTPLFPNWHILAYLANCCSCLPTYFSFENILSFNMWNYDFFVLLFKNFNLLELYWLSFQNGVSIIKFSTNENVIFKKWFSIASITLWWKLLCEKCF